MTSFRAPQPRDVARIAGFPWPAGAALTPASAAPPIDGIPRESGLVQLARLPALNEDGTTVGPQVAARTGLSHSRASAASCPTLSPCAPTGAQTPAAEV
jgi:hypothetical protein